MNLTLHELAHRLGGEVHGLNVLVPGPGHSPADRSLSIRIEPTAPNSFIVHSFAGDSPMECRDHVRSAIGALPGKPKQPPKSSRSLHSFTPNRDADHRSALALKLWNEGRNPRGTLVATYLTSRGLTLPDAVANNVIRFHPALKNDGASVAGMLAIFRDIKTDEPCGLHRTFLDDAGRKLGRKMLGRARHAAIKLDADECVTLGLHIGEGVESCLAAFLAGFRPVWALGSATAIATFPVLAGIDAITVLGEVGDDETNYRATQACGKRWTDAGRDAFVVVPQVGDDLNDVWQGVTP
jgi:hypothetical protein